MSCATSNFKSSLIFTLVPVSPLHNQGIDIAAVALIILWLPCSAELIGDRMDTQSQFLGSESQNSALKYLEL